VTLNDTERRNGLYFALFHRISVRCRRKKSSRLLADLLVSFLYVSAGDIADVRYLWPPYGIGQAIIFLPCGFYLSSFFPRLISAVGDWMSTILPHMVWP